MNYFKKFILNLPFVKKEIKMLREFKDNNEDKITLDRTKSKIIESLTQDINSIKNKYQIAIDGINEKDKKIFELEGQIKSKWAKSPPIQRNDEELKMENSRLESEIKELVEILDSLGWTVLKINGKIQLDKLNLKGICSPTKNSKKLKSKAKKAK